MSTVIYPSPIFGPIHSRRLGVSLGVNLMPSDGKICTFNCIYCECGFNEDHRPKTRRPTRAEVAEGLEAKLKEMNSDGVRPDVLTFAGNGEPCGHPDFDGIIDDTIALRDKYCPAAKVSVLSNSTYILRQKVHDALMKVDNNILKLDTVSPEYIRNVDRPTYPTYDVRKIIEGMRAFNGHAIIQTMFMHGSFNAADPQGDDNAEGLPIDVSNTSEEFVEPWLDAVKHIQPQEVMVYTIDRETPDHNLKKATREELDAIRDRVLALGIPCTASY